MPSTYVTEASWSDMLAKAGSVIFDFDSDRFAKNSTTAQRRANSWKRSSSIARLSKELIMSFPTVCSNIIDPKTALMINKAIERKNVTFLQLIAANYHLTGSNGADVIKSLHTNMGVNYNVDDYIDKALDLYGKINEVRAVDGTHYAVIQEEMRQNFLRSTNKRYPVSSFSEHSIRDFKINKGRIFVVNEDRIVRQPNFGNLSDEQNWRDAQMAYNYDKLEQDAVKTASQKKAQEEKWSRDERRQQQRDEVQDQKDWNKEERERERDRYQREKDARDAMRQNVLDKSQYFQKQLLDSDVKKANELMPTLISLRYQVISDPKNHAESVKNYIEEEIIAGVKSRLIAVPSEEITDRIVAMKKHGVNMTNLIRATTKETSFCKDFLGSIEMAKIDAKRDSKLSKTNPIWRSLQARSNKSKVRRLISKSNTAAAITTLVITRQEVDLVKNQYDIDLSNPVVAIEFMDNYNLMGLVIVDEQMEVAEFIYDGDAYFETLSFAGLEKENNGVNARQIVNLLNTRR
jgi:hypothetical protein